MIPEGMLRVPENLKGSDHPFRYSTWPGQLPSAFERVVRDLTYDEMHAMELSLLAIPLTALYLSGNPIPQLLSGSASLILLAAALFELPRESDRAGAHILSSETWYFVVPFVILSVMTYLVRLVFIGG